MIYKEYCHRVYDMAKKGVSILVKMVKHIYAMIQQSGDSKFGSLRSSIGETEKVSCAKISAFGALFRSEDGGRLSIIKELIIKFMQKGLKIEISEWNPKWGKGFDDILLINLRPEIMLIS